MIEGLSERLYSLRMRYGLSQKQVAERLWVSPSIVSAYETGERSPSLEVLLSLSYLYNCSVDYLLGRKSLEPGEAIPTNDLTDKQLQAIIALIEAFKE